MRPLLLGIILAAVVGCGGEQAESPRFEVLGHVAPGAYSGDVFAHRGYAYLSSYGGKACPAAGVRVYDVRDPRRPRRVATFAGRRDTPELARTSTEKTIVAHVETRSFRGDLAAVGVQRCRGRAAEGFALYDVTEPRRPRALAVVRTRPHGAHELWLAGARGHAYVYAAIPEAEAETSPRPGVPGRPDFRIFDVSNPRRPVEVGGWGAWKKLGIEPAGGKPSFFDFGSGNLVHSVVTNRAATRAFLSYWDLGTVILDVTDPRRPRYLGRTAPGPEGSAHSAALAGGGATLIETHEAAKGHPLVFDISRPASPRRLAEVRLPPGVEAAGFRGSHYVLGIGASVHDPDVRDGIAYFSWYSQGVVAVAVSPPSRPRFIARFLPPPARDRRREFCPAVLCRAVWGVQPYGEYVLASDIISGLWVLRLRR